jgi:hypothetical protein
MKEKHHSALGVSRREFMLAVAAATGAAVFRHVPNEGAVVAIPAEEMPDSIADCPHSRYVLRVGDVIWSRPKVGARCWNHSPGISTRWLLAPSVV